MSEGAARGVVECQCENAQLMYTYIKHLRLNGNPLKEGLYLDQLATIRADLKTQVIAKPSSMVAYLRMN